MSPIMQFLETAGREPALSPGGYAEAVATLQITDAQRQALLECDHASLNALLDGRARMICMINAPLDDEEHEPNPDDRDGDGVPDQDQPPLPS